MDIHALSSNCASDYVRTTPATKFSPDVHTPVQPRWVLYANVLVSLLQPLQYGWSTSQLNLTTFNHEPECNAKPVAPGTCLMFPGHTKAQWAIAVSAWIVGGMMGALLWGHLATKFGRKRIMMSNCLFIITGAVMQAGASSVWIFMGGRFISGIASGGATAVIPSFISEISPPQLRNKLGIGFQMAITVGNLMMAVTFFFADTSSGWRYIAGSPIALALLYLVFSVFVLVESPVWLVVMGKQQVAEQELARLYGKENVHIAMSWIKQNDPASRVISGAEFSMPQLSCNMSDVISDLRSFVKLFSSIPRRQLLAAIGVAAAQQLTGINAVFFYSSSLFEKAGIADVRIGIVIVNFVNVLPTVFCGIVAARIGNRKLMLLGLAGMFFSAVGITVSLFFASFPGLAIVFTACYVATFGLSLGSLAWLVMAALFSDDVRAMGTSICVGCSWLFNLAVGLSYPYIAAALVNFSFTPFMCTVALSIFFVYKVIPDTCGKTTQEIQDEFNARWDVKK